MSAAGVRFGSLSLKYPDGDPDLQKAMELIKEQVQKTTNFDLELRKVSSAELKRDDAVRRHTVAGI